MEFAWNQDHTVSLEKKNKNMLIGYAQKASNLYCTAHTLITWGLVIKEGLGDGDFFRAGLTRQAK